MSVSTRKWVVDDISNAALFDMTTGDLVAFFEKLKKMTISIDAKQTEQFAGTSPYAFHLTQQDASSKVTIENAMLDYNQLIVATGATLTSGANVTPTWEKLTVLAGPTITLTKGATMVLLSDRIVVVSKSHANAGVQLSRVASAPTALQYTISPVGVIVFGDSTLVGKDVRIFHDYTATAADVASVTTNTKNKPYKFVAYGKAFDDELNASFDVTIVIYKAQMLGTFMIDQQRKSATSNSLDLAVLDASRSDNKVIDIIAV